MRRPPGGLQERTRDWRWKARSHPEHFMTHLAVWEGLPPERTGPETQWGEHVRAEEYDRA